MIRIREAGDAALLLELEAVVDPAVNARAVAIAGAVRAMNLRGVRDVVSTYRSVAVYFDALVVDVETVRTSLDLASAASGAVEQGRTIDVPVVYGGEDGPDLADVAAHAALSPEQVIARHSEAPYRVFMLGFLPGFAYMGSAPAEIATPRRATPRQRVPGGSVALADRQTAIYPWDSPGGWQIIGRTPLRAFDAARVPAALFAPGDTVRFVPTSGPAVAATAKAGTFPAGWPVSRDGGASGAGRAVTVQRPGLFTTIQDSGRWGHQSIGVSVCGSLDSTAHRTANALVGNEPHAATIEATVIGPELRVEADATIAVSGGDLGAAVDGSPLALNTATRLRAGSVLQFRGRRAGARASIAFDGGIAVPPVLGSRATHALTRLGGLNGRPLATADRVPLGVPPRTRARRPLEVDRPVVAGGVRVRVLPGPQDDFFADEAFARLQSSRFVVSPHSDRMGFRLQGARIPRLIGGEMISDATFTGAIQVPASGEPILLMADRQTTGGYPQIATVITADLPLAAQLAPGDWIEFLICSRTEAIKALVEQEGKILALE
jgi:KipI family sensor histidine kinase inhibitor